ncbi:AMP-binding protein [Shewanella sp. M16]|uniref:AMP-binding protein n=1 Tax=Shewanella sp. M16 TaxID=2830837 RepID=UPI001BAFDFDB|nr:AMP-binding protein [Shewanella sp. M16]MBS0043922.1 AMP-binding protein [Shewanella sp. M16]
MNLLQRLQDANYQATAISGDSDISYKQLINQALALRQAYPALQQQAVALTFVDLRHFVVALLALDGWCRALYLMPDSSLTLPESTIAWPLNSPLPVTSASTMLAGSIASAAPTRWYLATSGTTGTPKWIGHSFTRLSRAVKTSAQSGLSRWALCYQPSRFAGLQVLLQSVLSGARSCDCSRGDAQQRINMMRQHRVNAISATPSLWRQLLMTGQLNTLVLQQVTLGGEIADQALLNTLSRLFPKARLLHIYASTEAGAGFAVADKRAGFPSSWLSQHHSGLALKVDNQQHLWLKPPQAAQASQAEQGDHDGYLDTEDLVSIEEDRVIFLGRASGVINVGGNKVHPEQVEQVLLLHPSVLQARVYAKASSVLGQLVVTDIVAVADIDRNALQLQLLLHCQQYLQRYQFPTRFNFVTGLATNATGKLSRQTEAREPYE